LKTNTLCYKYQKAFGGEADGEKKLIKSPVLLRTVAGFFCLMLKAGGNLKKSISENYILIGVWNFFYSRYSIM